jgi:hypothetical protein
MTYQKKKKPSAQMNSKHPNSMSEMNIVAVSTHPREKEII